MNKFYSEFALVTRIKFPFFPRPNLIFYKTYVTSRNGPLMHNTTAYTSHIQNRNTWVIVEYHIELWENSKSSYTLVWATEKKVQELLSKSVHELWFPSLYMDKEPLVHCTCDILGYPQKMAHQPIIQSQVFGLWGVLCGLKFFLCYKGNYQYFNVTSHCYRRAWSSDEFLAILMRLCLSFTMIFPYTVQVSFIWPEFLRERASWARFARNFVKSSLI